MMRQYQEAKRACGDALLLFRMGDFYEMFFDDAKVAARTLHLALTSRDKGADGVPMAGFPHHQLESYLGKLIAAGLRAAVCEQVEDPKLAKGLVKREVTRIVSPGTVTDDALLDPRRSNYLAAVVARRSGGVGVGGAFHGPIRGGRISRRRLGRPTGPDRAGRMPVGRGRPAAAAGRLDERMMVTRRPGWAFSPSHGAAGAGETFRHRRPGRLRLRRRSRLTRGRSAAAGAVLDYLAETQKTSLAHIDRLVPYRTSGTLEIDQSSRRSLEITRTIREGRREGSLLAVLDRTATAMGSRLLADWLANPLTDAAAITRAARGRRASWSPRPRLSADLRETLRRVYDVERLLGPRDHRPGQPPRPEFSRPHAAALPALKAKLTARKSPLLNRLEAEIDLCVDLRSKLDAALADDLSAGQPGGRLHPRRLSSAAGRLAGVGPRRQAVDRPLPGPASPADRHPHAEGRLQQGLRLLPGNHQRPPRAHPRRLHPQADGEKCRALHHARAEGI